MYKIMMVDDEPLVLTSLKACVDWNAYGFKIAGQAGDGEEALALIAELQPHVVFTDIRMPGISGFELIQRSLDNGFKGLFVVISGYAEFDYVRKALKHGVLGYCLKPFDKEEIEEMLEKAAKALGHSALLDEMELLSVLDDPSDEGKGKMRKLLASLGLEDGRSAPGLQVLVTIGDTVPAGLQGEGKIRIKLGSRKNLFLLRRTKVDDIRAALENAPVQGAGLVYCDRPADALKEAVEEATLRAYDYFVREEGDDPRRLLGQERSASTEKLYPALQKLDKAVADNEPVAVRRELQAIRDLFAGGDYQVMHAVRVYNMVLTSLSRTAPHPNDEFMYSWEQLLGTFRHVREMFAYLIDRVVHRAGLRFEPEVGRNDAFKAILQYVNEHYYREISLQSLTATFNFTASYISQLFRKELGETLTEYVMRLRISYACDLLRTTEMSVFQIGEKVGYDDYFYFTKVFKKKVGLTASAYRKQQLS